MKEIQVSSFNELKGHVENLRGEYGWRCGAGDLPIENPVLFRGQAEKCKSWGLKSTLERTWAGRHWTLKRYFEVVRQMRPVIEAWYPLPFSKPSQDEIDSWLKETETNGVLRNIPSYDYLLYLRHHGLPSPLVDWTASLYIAAYFAFSPESAAERAIYVFVEMPTGGKVDWTAEPQIYSPEQNVTTDKRHFLQQARYTICYRQAAGIPLAAYDGVVSGLKDGRDQDLVWKFIIPSSERKGVLGFLESVNITSFSLMPSEETLLSSLWLREVTLPGLKCPRDTRTQ